MLRPGSLAGGSGRSEHISLESDVSESRAKPQVDQPITTFELNNRARGVITEVAILANHYAAVTIRRRVNNHSHNIDLRFVDSRSKAYRHVSWKSLYATLAATVATAIVTLLFLYTTLPFIQNMGLIAITGFATIAIVFGLICYYRTTESLYFLSVHGRVPVIAITGNLGTFRKAKPCVDEVVRRIASARAHFKQEKASYLRDEMREHARLREQGALTEQQYHDAKMRILQAHS